MTLYQSNDTTDTHIDATNNGATTNTTSTTDAATTSDTTTDSVNTTNTTPEHKDTQNSEYKCRCNAYQVERVNTKYYKVNYKVFNE